MSETRNKILEDILAAIQSGGGVLPADNARVGFLNYDDSGSASISVTADTATTITNDELGAKTIKTYAPSGVSDVWNATSNRIDFSDLSLGDMLDLRVDLQVTTSSPNTNLKINLLLGSGTSAYTLPFYDFAFKTAGSHDVHAYNGFYLGDNDTLNNSGELQILSDEDCSVTVNGFYFKVIIRG
jgi:hypothetical protein